MKEVEESLQALVAAIKKQECCVKYKETLEILKSDRELFARFNEFRRKNMELHMRKNTLSEQSELRKEYDDLLTKEQVSNFLCWEQKTTELFRGVYDAIAEEIDLDYSFLD